MSILDELAVLVLTDVPTYQRLVKSNIEMEKTAAAVKLRHIARSAKLLCDLREAEREAKRKRSST
jgi:hypothetical protein